MESAIHHHPVSPLTTSERMAYTRRERTLMLGKLSKMILFFYVLSLFRPVVPVAADFIAHTFYEQQHILQVHEVKGKFHMHNEMSKELQHGDHDKGSSASYDTVEYSHVQTLAVTFIRPAVSVAIPSEVQPYLLPVAIDIDSPPPCSQQVARIAA